MQFDKSVLIGAGVALAVIGYLVFGPKSGTDLPADIVSGNGRIEAVQVDVSTRIAGRVQEILAKEGDLVEKGQKVAVIDSAQLRAQLLRANADVASAQSQAASAEATIAQMKAQLILASQELVRTTSLFGKGHTTQEALDTRVSQKAVAEANLKASEALLVSRQQSILAAQAGVQEIQTQIDDCELVVPTIGRVLYRLAEEGEVLSSGGKVLTLVNLSDIYMEIFLPSSEAHKVSIGSEARIKLDILDFVIPAKVSFVSPESQFTPKQVETADERDNLMFRVKVRVPSELVRKHIEKVKTGIRGVAYVRLDGMGEPSVWPASLQKMPPDAVSVNNGQSDAQK